jgi:hypothetical protein
MGVEFDERVETIDCLLERFYEVWDSTDEEKKRSIRRQFYAEKNIGKKWCQLVSFLSEGILVVAGNDVDVQMLEYCFPIKHMRGETDIGPGTVFHLTGRTRWLLRQQLLARIEANSSLFRSSCEKVPTKTQCHRRRTKDMARCFRLGRHQSRNCRLQNGARTPYTLVNPPKCRHSASDTIFFLRAALDL